MTRKNLSSIYTHETIYIPPQEEEVPPGVALDHCTNVLSVILPGVNSAFIRSRIEHNLRSSECSTENTRLFLLGENAFCLPLNSYVDHWSCRKNMPNVLESHVFPWRWILRKKDENATAESRGVALFISEWRAEATRFWQNGARAWHPHRFWMPARLEQTGIDYLSPYPGLADVSIPSSCTRKQPTSESAPSKNNGVWNWSSEDTKLCKEAQKGFSDDDPKKSFGRASDAWNLHVRTVCSKTRRSGPVYLYGMLPDQKKTFSCNRFLSPDHSYFVFNHSIHEMSFPFPRGTRAL